MNVSIATVCLAGDLRSKVYAATANGFDGIELFEPDLTASDLSPEALRGLLNDLGMGLYALQPFRDFEGMLDHSRSRAFERAKRKFELMHRLGTSLLLICSNVSPDAVDGAQRAADDLAELGDLARLDGFRIGYEALAWGRHVRDYTAAWQIVERAAHPAVGLVLDSYHLFARGNPVDAVRQIPSDKIALVQISDAPRVDMEVLRHSRHLRNFPGQGDFPIADFVDAVLSTGYDDVLSLEVFNDDFRASPTEQTARDGMRSIVWLQDQVRAKQAEDRVGPTRAVHAQSPWITQPVALPSVEATGFGFVEFAAATEHDRDDLGTYLTRAGFVESHRHRSKAVSVYSLGDAHVVVDSDPNGYARRYHLTHGSSVTGYAVTVPDAVSAARRAELLLAPVAFDASSPRELRIPAVSAVGDSRVYLLDGPPDHWLAVDFVPVPDADAGIGPAIDHVSLTVAPHEFLSALFFHRAVLGLELTPATDLTDPFGLVTSRALVSRNGGVRVPLNTASSERTGANQFRRATGGSGVQHVAVRCPSLDDLVCRVDPGLVLPIAANYYDDIRARFGLTPDTIAYLAANNFLYDEDAGGTFLQLYTRPRHGVFFEFIERRSYSGFGAPNAPIRLAAQAREMIGCE